MSLDKTNSTGRGGALEGKGTGLTPSGVTQRTESTRRKCTGNSATQTHKEEFSTQVQQPDPGIQAQETLSWMLKLKEHTGVWSSRDLKT